MDGWLVDKVSHESRRRTEIEKRERKGIYEYMVEVAYVKKLTLSVTALCPESSQFLIVPRCVFAASMRKRSESNDALAIVSIITLGSPAIGKKERRFETPSSLATLSTKARWHLRRAIRIHMCVCVRACVCVCVL